MDPYGFSKKIWSTSGVGQTVTRYRDKPVTRAYGELTATGGNRTCNQSQGAYAGTLIDPWHVRDVRIPDLASYPTSTTTVETEFLWTPDVTLTTANSQGIYVYATANPAYRFCQGNVGGTASPGALTASTTINYLGGTTINTNFTECRLVSLGICIKFAGNDTNSAGMINIVSIPAQPSSTAGMYNINDASTYTAGVTAPTAERVYYSGPLREGAVGTYRPYDATSFFQQVPVGAGSNNYCYGLFAISLQLPAGSTAPSFTVQIVANLEGIQKLNSNAYGSGAIAMDGAALEHGLALGGEVSPVLPADENTMENIASLGTALARGTSTKKRKL